MPLVEHRNVEQALVVLDERGGRNLEAAPAPLLVQARIGVLGASGQLARQAEREHAGVDVPPACLKEAVVPGGVSSRPRAPSVPIGQSSSGPPYLLMFSSPRLNRCFSSSEAKGFCGRQP